MNKLISGCEATGNKLTINAFCRISVLDIRGEVLYRLAPLLVLLILIRESACQNSSKVNCPTWPRLVDEWIKWYTMISSGTGFAATRRTCIN